MWVERAAIGRSRNRSTNERATGKLFKEIFHDVYAKSFCGLGVYFSGASNKLKITFVAISLTTTDTGDVIFFGSFV